MIAVGIEGHTGRVTVTSNLTFAQGFLAVTDIVSFSHKYSQVGLNIVSSIQIFAYAGHVAFFTFIAEMKKPEDFPKTLYTLQICDTTLYLIVGIVVYSFVGDTVISPALGNTGVIVRKVAYGIALPTIIVAGVVNGHVCAKLVFVRMCVLSFPGSYNPLNFLNVNSRRFRRNGKKSRHMNSHSFTGWATWIAICFAIWALAFVIAEV